MMSPETHDGENSIDFHASLQRAELGVDYLSIRVDLCVSVCSLLGEAQNIWFCSIQSEILENHTSIIIHQ